MTAEMPFWKTKRLEQLTNAEWESLCDGCGLCCLHKLEDEDTGEIYATSVACKLLNAETCQCADYPNRKSIVPDCIRLDIKTIRSVRWLPKTCAYKLIDQGKDLEWWHPLVSENAKTVHEAHISAHDKIRIHEDALESDEDYLNYLEGPINAD